MKIDFKEIKVTREIYIAEDGTEFNDKDECLEYEMRLCEKTINFYDGSFNKSDFASCVYADLPNSDAIQALINICDYERMPISGLENPGVYLYDEEAHWHKGNVWVNLTEGMAKIKELGNFATSSKLMENAKKDKVAHAYATLFNLHDKATKTHMWEAIEEAIGYLGEVLQ